MWAYNNGDTIFNCAAWNKKENLDFIDNGASSSIVKKDGRFIVNGNKIDDIIQENEVNFMKLDVEEVE